MGRQWSPSQVCFDHDAPADTSEHSRVFAATVRFSSGVTSLHVPNDILDEPAAKADPGLLEILDSYAAGLLEKTPGGPSLSERIRTLLQRGLQDGVPTAEEAAAQLNMSVRSLHRGLNAEGSSYRGSASPRAGSFDARRSPLQHDGGRLSPRFLRDLIFPPRIQTMGGDNAGRVSIRHPSGPFTSVLINPYESSVLVSLCAITYARFPEMGFRGFELMLGIARCPQFGPAQAG